MTSDPILKLPRVATKKIKWCGKERISLSVLRLHGYTANVEPGATFTLPAGLVDALLKHKSWQLVKASKPKAEGQPRTARKPRAKKEVPAAAPESDSSDVDDDLTSES